MERYQFPGWVVFIEPKKMAFNSPRVLLQPDEAEDEFLRKAKDLMVATHDSDGTLYVITHDEEDLKLAEKLGGEIARQEVEEI